MKVFIIVDLQNDFIDGALGTREAEAIVPNVVEKIKQAQGKLVVTTQDTHEENYLDTLEGKKLPVVHCIRHSDGWNINHEVQDAIEQNQKDFAQYENICKITFGYEGWKTFFGNMTEKPDEIEICGLCTDICVISNALILRALFPNTKIIVDSACCAGVTPQKHEAALEVMRSCQIDVV